MDEKNYWVGFSLIRGIGYVRLTSLRGFFGDLEIAWNASPLDLKRAGLHERVIRNLIQERNSLNLQELVESYNHRGISILTLEDSAYPEILRNIDQPPPVLYLRGHLEVVDARSIAIVGTRRITSYGRQVTSEIAAFLAAQGITVVSGLARGVDKVAHKSALDAGGRTIAILGCGVDVIYPPEHAGLYEQITIHGAIISDYAPGTPPEGNNFPPRNRIISGISLASVIVEAGEVSGALITASFAANQGREVFSVPGPIYAIQSKGTNRLIANGAHPLLSPKDIMDVLDITTKESLRQARLEFPTSGLETRLLEIISSQPLHVDEICAICDSTINQISASLVMLELKGLVRQIGGLNYVSTREK